MKIDDLMFELENKELQIENLIAELTAANIEIKNLRFAVGMHQDAIKALKKREAGLLEQLAKARGQEVRIR